MRRSRIRRFRGAALVAFAVAVTGGGIIATNQGGVVSGTAHVWVTDGTCTATPARQSAPKTFADTPAGSRGCTFDQAWDVANAGDTIRVETGTYGDQTITGDKTATTYIIADANTTVGALTTSGDHLELQKAKITGGWDAGGVSAVNDVTLRDVEITGEEVYLQSCCDNFKMIGGSVHGIDNTRPGLTLGGIFLVFGDNGASTEVNNVLIDGVEFYDAICNSASGDHFEPVRIQGWVDGLTIRNSYFHDNDGNTSQIFFSSLTAGASHPPTNAVIEGNYFGLPRDGICGAGNGLMVNSNFQDQPCPNMTVRYNTAPQTFVIEALAGFSCTGTGTVQVYGNVTEKDTDCSLVYSYNVYIRSAGSANCGTGDQTVASTAAAGLTGDGFHLSSTSVARAAGNPSVCPAKDRDGDSRPLPAATTCDAGADERD